MADRDRFGESDRDYAYTDYSGRQGLDVRNPADAAKQRHQFQYLDKGRTVVSDTEPAFTDFGHNRNFRFPQRTGTPNFRPPYGAPGQPSYNEWQQQIDPFHTGPYPPKKHPNPRMRGMMGGLGGLQEQAAIDPSDWRVIQQIIKAGGNPDDYMQTAEFGGYGYNPDPNKTYDDYYTGQDIIDMEVLPGGGYDPADEYKFDYKRNRFKDLLEGKWPQYAARGGLMSLRR